MRLMINIYLLKQQLSPEQNKVLDELLDHRENTLLAYKELQKQYSNTKRNVKTAEKKLIAILPQLPENSFTPRWIEGEIGSIENKYTAIDKAIKNYKQSMQFFNKDISSPWFRAFN